MTSTQPPSEPALPSGYTLHPGFPSVADYRHIRQSSGLAPVTESMAQGAVTGSWYGCYITHAPAASVTAGQPVAMGRIIGDGGWYFHIADMATLPEHQRKGLGGAVMRHLLAYIKDNSPADGAPFVNLFADPPGIRLYEKNGFVDSETLGELGMILKSSARYGQAAQSSVPHQ